MKINRIYKPKRFDNFTIVPNCVFRTKNISIGATGLYAYLFSHDSSKPITIRFIINHFKEGKDAINSKIKGLEKFNWYVLKPFAILLCLTVVLVV